MSILQEYEEIRTRIGKDTYNAIEEYLTKYPQIYLSDIYYNEDGWNKFEEWCRTDRLTPDYFKQKYSDLPRIDEYLELLLNDADIAIYDIDNSLDIIKNSLDIGDIFLLSTVGADTADKIYKMKWGE